MRFRCFSSSPSTPALLVLALIAAIGTTSCQKEETPEGSIARVGNRYLTYWEFEHYLARMIGEDVGRIEPEASSAMLDQMLETALLSQVAASRGLAINDERVEAAVLDDPGSSKTEKRDELLRDALIEELFAGVPHPSDEEIREYHRDHIAEFTSGERAHLRQILLRDEAEARRVRTEIARGKSFEDAAREHSIAHTAERGGDIGTVSRGDLPRTLESAVFDLSPGEISQVIETSGTFHIFKMIEKFPAGVLDVEKTRPLIVSRTRGEALSRLLVETTNDAKRSIRVVVFPSRLDFDYTGSFPVDRSE